MSTALRIVRTLALSLWVGGLVFFAFAVVPVAFSVLPTRHLAGTVVAASLTILHWLGLVCGTIYLLSSLVVSPRTRSRHMQILLGCAMLVLTAVSQFVIIPPMERDRLAAGGAIDNLPAESPLHRNFDHLHHLSERTEGVILLCGLAALSLTAGESAPRSTAR